MGENSILTGELPGWIPRHKRDDFINARDRLLGIHEISLHDLQEAINEVLELHAKDMLDPVYAMYERQVRAVDEIEARRERLIRLMARVVHAVNLGEMDGLPVLMDPDTANRVFKGDDYGKHQSQNASNPRSRIKGITEESFSISHLVSELAEKRDSMGDPLKSPDLWPELFALLVDRELEPKEYDKPTRYTFLKNDDNDRDEILYTSFKVMLSKARRC
jgi:hypothetical protein